jgi:GNAT superfamily N-acetyltransferase
VNRTQLAGLAAAAGAAVEGGAAPTAAGTGGGVEYGSVAAGGVEYGSAGTGGVEYGSVASGGVQYRGVGEVEYRGVGAADCDGMRSFLAGLSPRTRFLRFFAPASPPSPAVLRGMCGGGRTTDALVATHDGVIVGHAMAADSVSPEGCLVSDVGVVVADGWQNRGIGAQILDLLVARAMGRGASVLVMDVLPENKRMLGMISRRWADAGYRFSGGSVTARVYLPGVAAAKGACGGADLRAA